MAQVDQAAQASLPAATLNVPPAQSAHIRSALAVGALVWYLPAAQAPETTVQAAPSSAALKVVPLLHAAHWRSTVALPATDSPWPAGQVDQASQAALPVATLKKSVAQALHTRSDESVGAVVS